MVKRVFFAFIILIISIIGLSYSVQAQDYDGRLITVYDRGEKSVFLTTEKTLGEAFKANGVELDTYDMVEPSVDEELVAPDYQVNIYRSRPVVVIDGATRAKVITPYQTVQHIARDAGINLYDEDEARLQRATDFINDGAGLQLLIKRATPIVLELHGNKNKVRTQAKTVGAMLEEKQITLGKLDRLSVDESTPITKGLNVRVWREGRQTITVERAVQFETEQIFDADRPVGYRHTQTPGVLGVRAVTYEVEIKDGSEVSRKEIVSIITTKPKKEVVTVGIKSNPNSLTKSKGANFFTDSNGVVHRETYYDLEMGRVMQNCGQGGLYTVRVDGVKVDSQGYVIVAAHLGRYPRCSLVETSVGMGKVYDTGGFAAVHPDGIDIATDWTNNNGR